MSKPSEERRPVGFLGLPAELRNKIYEFYFEDESLLYDRDDPFDAHDYPIELCDANDYHPSPDITLVSRQIRRETVELYMEATAAFWRDHSFYVCLDATREARDKAEEVIDCMFDILSEPEIQTLEFWIWVPGDMFSYEDQLIFTATATAVPHVDWTYVEEDEDMTNDENYTSSRAYTASTLLEQWLRAGPSAGSGLVMGVSELGPRGSAQLDVESCIQQMSDDCVTLAIDMGLSL